MIKLITKDNMKKAEAAAVEGGLTYRALMENAGAATAEYILRTVSPDCKTAVILCGRGNNGGDGFVIARKLRDGGIPKVCAVCIGEQTTEDSAYMRENIGKALLLSANEADRYIAEADIIVDALFGTGLTRPPEGEAARLITLSNESRALRFAVDIPSGAECDTGRVAGVCFHAEHTVSFAAMKPCHILPPSNAYCGRVEVAGIGIPDSITEKLSCGELIPPFKMKKRDKNSHKGSFGTALSVCGSYGMSGAALMSAEAALRCGVGIMKAAVIPENYEILAKNLPEAVLIPCESRDGRYSAFAVHILKKNLKTASALLIGCGLGASSATAYLTRELALSSHVPVIIDADGINATASDIEFIKQMKAPLVLTPHPGEMARLLGVTAADVEADRIGAARGFAKKHGVWLVLKGANTVVADPEGKIYLNVSGNPGMATGGSGDVLSGIMLALLAEGCPLKDAVCGAVRIHGDAGDLAAEKLGETSLLPRDMIDALPSLFKTNE